MVTMMERLVIALNYSDETQETDEGEDYKVPFTKHAIQKMQFRQMSHIRNGLAT